MKNEFIFGIEYTNHHVTRGNYTISVVADNAATPPTYYVEAVPKSSQSTNDSRCGTLRLTNTGVKTASGGGADCW